MKKIKWIDTAKGIGILLVILGHSPFDETVIKAIFAFHMPFFFFVSGYLFHYSKYRENKRGFVEGKFKRLIVPYFVTNLIILSFYSLKSNARHVPFSFRDIHAPFSFADIHAPLSFKDIHVPLSFADMHAPLSFTDKLTGILYGNGAPLEPPTILTNTIDLPSWFLTCLFCAYMILYLIAYCHEKYGYKYSTVLSVLIVAAGLITGKFVYLPWGLDIACVSMLFMFPGYLIYYYNVRLPARLHREYVSFALVLLLLCIIAADGMVDMNVRMYSNVYLFTAGGLLGTYFIILLAKKITEKKNILSGPLMFLGENSLTILLYHFFALDIALTGLKVFGDLRPLVNHSALLTASGMLLTSVAVILVLKRVPVLKNIY